MMKFKDWMVIREVGTCTGSIANFSLPLFSGGNMVSRTSPPLLLSYDDSKKKKHKKKKKKE